MTRRTGYDADDETSPADAYTVRGFRGIACRVLGWETEPDEDTEWTGIEERTGRVVVRNVRPIIKASHSNQTPYAPGRKVPRTDLTPTENAQ